MRIGRAAPCAAAMFVVWTLGESRAQTVTLDRDEVRDALSSAFNGQFVLTEGPAISAGSYEFGSTDVRVSRLPLRVPVFGFGGDDPGAPRFQPYVGAVLGYSEARTDFRVSPEFGRNTLVVEAIGALGEISVAIAIAEKLTLTPRLDFGYTRLDSRLRGDPEVKEALEPIRDQITDWRAELLSYGPGLELSYRFALGPVGMRTWLDGVYLHSETISSTDPIQDVEFDTTLASLGLEAEVPLGVAPFDWPLVLGPSVVTTLLTGEAADGLDTDFLVTPGLSIFAELDERVPFVSRLGVGGSYTVGDNVEGWNVGAVFAADFGGEPDAAEGEAR